MLPEDYEDLKEPADELEAARDAASVGMPANVTSTTSAGAQGFGQVDGVGNEAKMGELDAARDLAVEGMPSNVTSTAPTVAQGFEQLDGVGNEPDDDMFLEPAVQPQPLLCGIEYIGLPPPPRPLVDGPTPKEFLDAREAKILQSSEGEVADNEAATPTQSGGWRSMLGKAVKVAKAIEKTAATKIVLAEQKIRAVVSEQAEMQFRKSFPIQAQGNKFVAAYHCQAQHKGTAGPADGQFTISEGYLCFAAWSGLHTAIPLESIVSIQLAVALECYPGNPPYFVECPNEDVIAGALDIYTRDHIVYTFHNFSGLGTGEGLSYRGHTSTALERAYNYLDHEWRRSVSVPLEDIEYQSPGKD